MINIIKKYINYVDENYHSDFTEEDIKNITGYSYQYFNRRFKEIWNMTPQVYRKRRQLTLIALEIKNKSIKFLVYCIQDILKFQSISIETEKETINFIQNIFLILFMIFIIHIMSMIICLYIKLTVIY